MLDRNDGVPTVSDGPKLVETLLRLGDPALNDWWVGPDTNGMFVISSNHVSKYEWHWLPNVTTKRHGQPRAICNSNMNDRTQYGYTHDLDQRKLAVATVCALCAEYWRASRDHGYKFSIAETY